MRATIVVLMTVLISACSVFGVRSGYEQAAYTLVDRIGETVEVRRYPPQLVAEATVPAPDEQAGRSRAFRLLFDFISGANQTRADIAMTTPVEIAAAPEPIAMTSPVEIKSEAGGRYTMRFFLPAAYTLETAPRPTNPDVRLVETPERTLAVLRFTGSTSPANAARHVDELEAILHGSRWQPAGDAAAMFYDPPWTLPFLRRNEVAMPVIAVPAAPGSGDEPGRQRASRQR